MAQAFLLRFDDLTELNFGDYVRFPAGPIIIGPADNFKVSIIAQPLADVDHYRPLGGRIRENGLSRVIVFANRNIILTPEFTANRQWTSPIAISQIQSMEFVRQAGRLDLFINGNIVSGGFNSSTDQFFSNISV